MSAADATPSSSAGTKQESSSCLADMLAARFGWPTQTLRDYMRRGLVASRVERGEGADAGRWRLSVRCGNRRWQAVVEADGTVGTQRVEVLSTGAPKPAR